MPDGDWFGAQPLSGFVLHAISERSDAVADIESLLTLNMQTVG